MLASDIGLIAVPGGCRIQVRVAPRSSANRLLGPHGGALKIALSAPPVEGAANRALIEFLADLLSISRSHITIDSGQTGRNKSLIIEGMAMDAVLGKLRLQLGSGVAGKVR